MMSYVTYISRDEYVPIGSCLARQLQAVQSRAPLSVLFDDRSLSHDGSAELRRNFHANALFDLTSLFAKLDNGSSAFYGKRSKTKSSKVESGRRLYATDQYFTPWLKLWLWALPFKSIVFLDADVLVLRNIDEVLTASLAAPHDMAAMPVQCPLPTGMRLTAFNTGLMWLRPSLKRLKEIQRFAHQTYEEMSTGRKLNKACERRISDQTLLFWFCKGRVHRLPAALPAHLNVDASQWAQWTSTLRRNRTAASVIHYLGEPKPWSLPPSTLQLPPHLNGPHFALWHARACPRIQP